MKKNRIYILVFLVATIACNNVEQEIHDEEDDHSGVKLQLTEYSNKFEVFAEADPFILGETSGILAHFTQLSDFKPLTEGSVRIELHTGTSGIGQTIEKPIRPGIYRFALKPEKAGKAKILFIIQDKKGNHKIVVKNIVVYANKHEANHNAEEQVIDNINSIGFTKEQSWKIDFETVLPLKKPFGKVIKTTAKILPDMKSETMVIAKTNGIVQFHKNITEGIHVSLGDVFLGVTGKGLANDNANIRFSEAKNNYYLAKSDYDRKLALSQQQIISKKEVESAKAAFENAKTVYENLQNNFNVNGQIVVSPASGVIKHVHVINGQYVEAGEVLYSIINNDILIVKAEVQQKHYADLSSIYSANIKSIINNKTYALNEVNGSLLSYGKSIDEDAGYLIPVNFRFENNNRFLSGSFVEIYLKTETNKNALVIPNAALIEEQESFFVFVQLTPELFEKREVRVGVSDGINSEIIRGLAVQERIVSKGAIIVKLAAVSNSLDPHAGHVH